MLDPAQRRQRVERLALHAQSAQRASAFGGMDKIMKSRMLFASAAMSAVLAGCAAIPLLAPDDKKSFCQVAVEERFGTPELQRNVYSSSVGPLAGAGEGASAGIGFGVFAVVAVPIGALIGAAASTPCAAAGMSHPNAEADFERFLHAADASVLTRGLQAELSAPRTVCSRDRADVAGSITPDAVVAIEKIDFQMGCLYGKQEYWINVQWKTTNAKTQRVLNSSATKCTLSSFQTVDDWFGRPERATAEIEGALARTGQRMAALLISENAPYECKLRSLESGEVVPQ